MDRIEIVRAASAWCGYGRTCAAFGEDVQRWYFCGLGDHIQIWDLGSISILLGQCLCVIAQADGFEDNVISSVGGRGGITIWLASGVRRRSYGFLLFSGVC